MSTAQLSDQQVIELGASLRAARETQGKDLSESAFRIALSPSQLRALESGDRRPFYSTHYFLQAAERYATFLGMALPDLLDRRTAMPPVKRSEDIAAQETVAHAMDDEVQAAAHQNAAASRSSAPPPPIAVLPSRGAVGSRKLPSAAVFAIGATIIALSAAVALKDSTPTATGTANVQLTSMAAAPAAEPPATPAVAAQVSSSVTQQGSASAAATPITTPPAAQPTPAVVPSVPAPKPTASGSEKDGRIESTVNAWVQIVNKSGEKSNLRIAAGERVEFVSSETAAVVIGQPEKTTLTVRGKAVDLRQYASSKDGSPRALVIIGDIRN